MRGHVNNVLNVSAYKFVPLPDAPALRERLFARAQASSLLGTVLLAEEGISANNLQIKYLVPFHAAEVEGILQHCKCKNDADEIGVEELHDFRPRACTTESGSRRTYCRR